MVLRFVAKLAVKVKPSRARLALRLWPRRLPVSLSLLHPVCVCVCVCVFVCVCMYIRIHTYITSCGFIRT